jgi:hypothetical protein
MAVTAIMFPQEAFCLHLVHSMKFLLAAFIIIGFSNFAFAEDSKIQIEQRSQVIIWDQGQLRGIGDAGDDVTDFTKPCLAEDDQSLESLRHRTLSSPAQIMQLTNSLLNSLGVHTRFAMNPISVFQGNTREPIFFLFPEIHIQESPSASTLLLHESRAMDMASLTNELVKNQINVLNFDEGPLGLPWKKTLPVSPNDSDKALAWAANVLKEYSISGAGLVGEAFSPKVKTAYNDDNDLWMRWVLTVFALAHQKWTETRHVLMKSSRVTEAKINLDNYKGFYNKLSHLSEVELKNSYSNYCENRSKKMVIFAYETAKAEGARVVFMSFGTLHAYGIIEQLKKYSASFIVFSPNYR